MSRSLLFALTTTTALGIASCGSSGPSGPGDLGSDPTPLPTASCDPANGGGSTTVPEPTLIRTLFDRWHEGWSGSPALVDLDGDDTVEIIVPRHDRLQVWHADGTLVREHDGGGPHLEQPRGGGPLARHGGARGGRGGARADLRLRRRGQRPAGLPHRRARRAAQPGGGRHRRRRRVRAGGQHHTAPRGRWLPRRGVRGGGQRRRGGRLPAQHHGRVRLRRGLLRDGRVRSERGPRRPERRRRGGRGGAARQRLPEHPRRHGARVRRGQHLRGPHQGAGGALPARLRRGPAGLRRDGGDGAPGALHQQLAGGGQPGRRGRTRAHRAGQRAERRAERPPSRAWRCGW
jgi:hypothetical protein